MSAGVELEEQMRKYLINIYQPDGGPPPPGVLDKVTRELDVVNQDLKDSGAWVFAGGLHPPESSTMLRPKGDDVLTVDGPFAEGKEHIGGFNIILAADLDAALEWGRRIAKATTLPVEVRPFHDDSGG